MERSPRSKKNMIPSSVKSKPKLVRPMPISAVGEVWSGGGVGGRQWVEWGWLGTPKSLRVPSTNGKK